ncbi:hypothetical protein TRVA0_001S08548 [Trichomonascus vanleenenianus]|uniref:uncharacterized protein n=1 Tax=Trichomonascus vanleenenianus TaxID=2268995 RepID=UPI003ECA1A42
MSKATVTEVAIAKLHSEGEQPLDKKDPLNLFPYPPPPPKDYVENVRITHNYLTASATVSSGQSGAIGGYQQPSNVASAYENLVYGSFSFNTPLGNAGTPLPGYETANIASPKLQKAADPSLVAPLVSTPAVATAPQAVPAAPQYVPKPVVTPPQPAAPRAAASPAAMAHTPTAPPPRPGPGRPPRQYLPATRQSTNTSAQFKSEDCPICGRNFKGPKASTHKQQHIRRLHPEDYIPKRGGKKRAVVDQPPPDSVTKNLLTSLAHAASSPYPSPGGAHSPPMHAAPHMMYSPHQSQSPQ